jgi:hypothetical protein
MWPGEIHTAVYRHANSFLKILPIPGIERPYHQSLIFEFCSPSSKVCIPLPCLVLKARTGGAGPRPQSTRNWPGHIAPTVVFPLSFEKQPNRSDPVYPSTY